jgi:RHS repeat-associated protein
LLTLAGDFTAANVVEVRRGEKFFEWSNHLGNVLATVSDRKIAHSSNSSMIDYYTADVISAQDYYPFGMIMPGRTIVNGSGYRFGFNGKENDKETASTTTYDYGFRVYNPALGKFLSVDPLTKSYPWYTPYQFAGNKPILAIDLDGLEEFVKTNWYDQAGKVYRSTLEFDSKVAPLNGDYIYSVHNYLNADCQIKSTQITTEKLSGLDFLNTQIGHANQRGNPNYDIKRHNNPVFQLSSSKDNLSLYMEFSSGVGSENTVVYGGNMIDDIKNMDQVKKITRDAVASFLKNDGKISGQETYTGRYSMPRSEALSIWIPGVLSDTKNPNNKLYRAEHFIGSFTLTIQMMDDGKTAIFTLADSKTFESQTDHQSKGNSFNRSDGQRKPFSSTFQRYIWTSPISNPSLPSLEKPVASDNTNYIIPTRQ